jgi:hypothetical protein
MDFDLTALQSEADFWEHAGYVATFLVIAGVVGETVADLTTWIRSEQRKKRTERLSALLLIAGLAAEIVSQVQSNNRNSLIAGVLSERAAKAELELAKIKAPRTLKPNQRDDLVTTLRRHQGSGFWIQTERDPSHLYGEHIDFADLLHGVFVDARWKETPFVEANGKQAPRDIPPNGDHGCSIASGTDAKSTNLRNAVFDALKDAEFECRSASDTAIPANLIVLEIAPK